MSAQSIDAAGLNLVCPLVEHERRSALEDSQFELELVENEYRARKTVFVMIESLWAARSIDQEAYLDYKRLRDRTKARTALLADLIAQRRTTFEQYVLVCAEVRGEAVEHIQRRIDALQAEFRRLDCELLGKEAAIAAIDFEFDEAMLEATRNLAAANIKSRYDLLIDEYDLSQSKARLQSYRTREANCRKRLAN